MAMLNHASGVMGQTYGVSMLGSNGGKRTAIQGEKKHRKLKKTINARLII